MTTSTNGQICFGFKIEEGTEFPWDDDKWDFDIDNWWVFETLGEWTPPFKLYDEDGEYIGGVKPSEEVIDKYYKDRREFEKNAPPLPVKLVNCCSAEYPEYILAVPSTCQSASRGYPESFDPDELQVDGVEYLALVDFCKKYGIETDEAEWWLSSYWG